VLNLVNACIKGGVDLIDLIDVYRLFMVEVGVKVFEDESYVFIMGGSDEMIDFQLVFVVVVR